MQEKLKNSPAAPQAPAGAGCADGAARRRRRRRKKRILSRRRRRRRRGRSRCLRCLRAHGEQGVAQACDCLRDAFLALSDAFLATRSSRCPTPTAGRGIVNHCRDAFLATRSSRCPMPTAGRREITNPQKHKRKSTRRRCCQLLLVSEPRPHPCTPRAPQLNRLGCPRLH